MTSLVRAKQLVLLTKSVRARKLVPGQLGACIKLVLIKPAWFVQESWLSYDLLGTCKTAGPLDQHRPCKKVGPWPTRSVHKVGSYQTSLVRARKLVILSPAWYVQNSWSSWPTSVRAKKLVPGQLSACIKLALIKPAWCVQESWLPYYVTSLVGAKQLVLLTNSVCAKKLVPGQLGACIKLALIKPAWYLQESWLSYD